jgi:hypothetical protein
MEVEMMKSALWMLVALAGCAEEGLEPVDFNDFVDDQVAPPLPQTMVLNLTDPLTPGQPVQIQVTGATPNSQIFLARSNGQIGAGQCPPQLAGGCLGITPGGSGYQLVPMRTNAAGTAQMSVPLPANLPLGITLVFQAVDPNGPKGSNTLSRTTASNCASDAMEPNDTSAAARSRSPGITSNLNACMSDVWDWYTIQATAGQMITVNVPHTYAEGDIDLFAMDGAGPNDVTALITNALEYDRGVIDLATVSFTAATTGTYWLAVQAYSDNGATPGSTYELDIQIQ